MRIAEINMLPYGSTGKIMLQIAETARALGHDVRTYSPVIYARRPKQVNVDAADHYTFGSFSEARTHYYLGSTFGSNGCYSKKGTRQLIRELQAFAPDVVHLHNLHCFCINLPLLFGYLKESGVKVVWTLHDCWSFTGKCPHFVMAKCDKWQSECHHCPQLSGYPKSRLDASRRMYRKKKKWFCGIENMTLVTPSAWLSGLVSQSFLKEYETRVIPNGIDLSVFQPTPSDFRKKHGLENKKVLLGVSFGWGKGKGLDVFEALARRLGDEYRIVLVGTNAQLDARLPENVISIHRTNDQGELAEIYSAADLFVNPTREDTFPTVNIEALACGTPVLTFRTGGSPEILDETCGAVVECDDIDGMEKEMIRICGEMPYSKEACRARAMHFNKKDRYMDYVKLYEETMQS